MFITVSNLLSISRKNRLGVIVGVFAITTLSLCVLAQNPPEVDPFKQLKNGIHKATIPDVNVTLIGKLELPSTSGPVVLRFDKHGYIEFGPEAVVPDSVVAMPKDTLKSISRATDKLDRKFGEWFLIKLKKGASCKLHYKSVEIDVVLDKAIQKPFYIDTKTLKIVYIQRDKKQLVQYSCNVDPDCKRWNVILYFAHSCCCNDDYVPAYGSDVSCDDDARDDRCGGGCP